MWWIRLKRGVAHETAQWLYDALNTGTLIILLVIILRSFPWWNFPLNVESGAMPDFAYAYCGLIIIQSMKATLKP